MWANVIKAHSKILYGSLVTLRSLSTCKVTEMHPLKMLKCYISFFWGCIWVNPGSYIISAILLVIKCKRPHSEIPHHFPTVLKYLTACLLRKTVKYEISGNFLLTRSPNFGGRFQVIWYFDMKSFLKRYLEHCQIKNYPRIHYHTLLGKRNASFGKKIQICITPNGIWAVLTVSEVELELPSSLKSRFESRIHLQFPV